MCDRCERMDIDGSHELNSKDGSSRLRLCPFCLSEVALYATRDEGALPFLEAMARRGLGAIWRGADHVYLLRSGPQADEPPRPPG